MKYGKQGDVETDVEVTLLRFNWPLIIKYKYRSHALKIFLESSLYKTDIVLDISGNCPSENQYCPTFEIPFIRTTTFKLVFEMKKMYFYEGNPHF